MLNYSEPEVRSEGVWEGSKNDYITVMKSKHGERQLSLSAYFVQTLSAAYTVNIVSNIN